jgi:PAS domain-containing protein
METSLDRLRELTLALEAAEEREKASQVRLATALKVANAGMWDWSIDDDLLLWDDTMMHLFGYNTAMFVSREDGLYEMKYDDFISRVHPEDRGRVQGQVNACLEDRVSYSTAYRVVWECNGVLCTSLLIHAAGDVVEHNGKVSRLVGICIPGRGVADNLPPNDPTML